MEIVTETTREYAREVFEETAAVPKELFWESDTAIVPQSFGLVTAEGIMVPEKSSYYPISKRIMDVLVASGSLLITLPIFGAIATAIKMTAPDGPVFHKQTRVGAFGREFTMFKFRTMVPGAHDMLEDLLHLNEAEGKVFKMKDDPRITGVGRFLRKFSLDELPQLLNVLYGDMSIVGNRPPLPNEVAEYTPWERRRLHGMPGITGLWQVSGRSHLPFEKMVELDVFYHNKRSHWLDIKLMMKTIPAALRGDGAY